MGTARNLLFKILPRRKFLEMKYKKYFGRSADLKNPTLFTEKLYFLKMKNEEKKQLINKLHDKFAVRSWIKDTIGEEYLTKLYGVYDNIDDVDFNILPKQFVLKLTKMNGMNMVCEDKDELDIKDVKEKFDKWLKVPKKASKYSEEAYSFEGKPKIICEEFLSQQYTDVPLEYTVHCFNGKAKMIIVDDILLKDDGSIDRVIRNAYDLDWNLMPLDFGRARDEHKITQKPENLEDIIKVAEKLAKEFDYVRVDLYCIDNKIIFREMTFIPMGGGIKITPLAYDKKIGEWLNLSN